MLNAFALIERLKHPKAIDSKIFFVLIIASFSFKI